MMSRNILNLSLLIIVGMLVFIIIWEPGKEDEQLNRLSSLNSDEINRIYIQRDALQDVQLEKFDDHWRMLSPYSIHADVDRIKAILKLLQTHSYTQFSAQPSELSKYGLASSLAQITFNDSNFQFGKIEHINNLRYIHLNKKIHLTRDLFYYQLRSSAVGFVSPNLFSHAQRISKLSLAEYQYEQKHDGSWLMMPNKNAVSADDLNDFIQNWQRLRATRISISDTQNSDETVNIEFSDGNNILFEILRNEDETFFIRRDLGLQYHIPQSMIEILFSPPTTDALQKF